MRMEAERQLVVEYCNKLITNGLVRGTGGNISVLDRQAGTFAISPSGMEYHALTPADIVVMDLAGKIVEGKRKPSSEHALHRIFYNKRSEVGAVVHTHSVYATVLGTLGEGLPASSYLVAFSGREVPCAPYASFGTPALAAGAVQAMGENRAVILANHGLVAVAACLPDAFNVAEQIEGCAEVYVKARAIGKPLILPASEMDRMVSVFRQDYGQIKK